MFMLISIILVCVIGLCFMISNKKHVYWKVQGVPHLKTTPIFGNVAKMITLQCTLSDLINSIYVNYEDYLYVGFYNFLTPALVLRDPEIISDCLIKNFDNFMDTTIRLADPIASSNPFFTSGAKWRRLRKEIAPFLSNSKIRLMHSRMENVCKDMIAYLERKECCTAANDLAFMFTGNNIMSCAYGIDGEPFSDAKSIMQRISEKMSMSGKVGSVTHTLGLFFPKLCHMLNISYLGKQTPTLFKDIILMALKKRENSDMVCNDFVDFLRETRKRDGTTYLGYAMSFFLDGYETSGYALNYALLELARNPSVQEIAHKEIDDVYNRHGSVYTYEAIKDMDYVESIVYETLRKHPIIKFLSRICTKDHTLPAPIRSDNSKDVIIKKGTYVYFPVEAINRDEKYYLNPKTFDPKRFSKENRKLRAKQYFLTFGEGPRACLGQQFAVTQIKMALASISLHFKIRINEKTVFPLGTEFYHLSKSPKNTVWLDFLPRR